MKSKEEAPKAGGWISVDQLPTESMKVKWLCADGEEDYGFYYSEQKEFASFDLVTTKPITHWMPFKSSHSSLPVSQTVESQTELWKIAENEIELIKDARGVVSDAKIADYVKNNFTITRKIE